MKSKRNIKTIIVGVDFSKYSHAVVKQARLMAKKLNAPLVLLHVYKNPLVAEQNAYMVLQQLSEHYENMLRERYEVHADEKVIIKCGSASEDIIQVARRHAHPLIVVGHRGNRTAVSKFFLGSTAETLALHSPYPVLIYRGQKTVLPKKILVPCDFSRRSRHAIEGSKKIGFMGAEFELHHILKQSVPILDYELWQSLEEEIKKLNDNELKKFKKKNSQFKVVETNSNDIVGEINRKSKEYDLIAISPREHKGMFANFGSVTSKIVRSGDTPVLVIP